MNLFDGNGHQVECTPSAHPKLPELMVAEVDLKFCLKGRNTLGIAAEGQGDQSYDTKRQRKSPSWTTNIAEIPIAR